MRRQFTSPNSTANLPPVHIGENLSSAYPEVLPDPNVLPDPVPVREFHLSRNEVLNQDMPPYYVKVHSSLNMELEERNGERRTPLIYGSYIRNLKFHAEEMMHRFHW
jgi:hypothetical protein